MRILSVIAALALALTLSGKLFAADEGSAPAEKTGHEGRHGAMMGIGERIDRLVKDLNITDEQKTKFEALKKEYAPKAKDAFKKMDDILTPEQKQARKDAVKAAKDAGKSPREVFEAAHKAVKLTDEQKAKMSELRNQMGPSRKELMEKVSAILTSEQKEQLKKKMESWQKDHPRHGGGEQ